jgi:hypothetical protein
LLLLLSPQGNFKPTKLPQPSFSTPPGNTMTEPSRNPLASNSLLPSQSTNQRPPSSPLTELSSIGRQLSPTQSCSLQSDLADCLLSPVLLRIAELQDCIDNDLPIPSRKKSTSSSSTAASFSAAPSRSRTSHPTSTTASDNIPPPKDLSPPARESRSLSSSFNSRAKAHNPTSLTTSYPTSLNPLPLMPIRRTSSTGTTTRTLSLVDRPRSGPCLLRLPPFPRRERRLRIPPPPNQPWPPPNARRRQPPPRPLLCWRQTAGTSFPSRVR